MPTGFAPPPNKASALADAISLASRLPRHYPSQYARQPRSAWTGTALGFLACAAVAGLWLTA